MTRLGRYHLINNSIIHRLLRRHEKVPITIGLNLILGLITVLRNISIQHLPNEQNLLGLDFNIGSLSLRPPERLMDHDTAVGKRASLAGSTGAQQKRSHAGSHAKAYGGDIAGNVLHGVVNGHAGTDTSPGTVDVECDILGGVLVGQVEELGNEDVGNFVVDALSEEDDAVLEEAGDDVFLGGAVVDYGHAMGNDSHNDTQRLPNDCSAIDVVVSRGRVWVGKVSTLNGNGCEIRCEYLGFVWFVERMDVETCQNTIGRVGRRFLDKLVRAMRTQTRPPGISIFEPPIPSLHCHSHHPSR